VLLIEVTDNPREEEPTTVQKHSREGYNLAALLFFLLFLDNLLRRIIFFMLQPTMAASPSNDQYPATVSFKTASTTERAPNTQNPMA
jgi:hypothetical protein